MLALIVRRLALALPLVLIVTFLIFALTSLSSADPGLYILGQGATKAQLAAEDHSLGLDQPMVVQYWHWLSQALTGNLGISYESEEPVSTLLAQLLPVTLSLVLLTTFSVGAVGVALGVVSAVRGGRIGRALDVLAMLGAGIPNFVLAVVGAGLAVGLWRLPVTGYVPLGQDPAAWLGRMILPVFCLSLGGFTAVARMTRDSMGDVLGREYIDALRADGVPERRIILRHALRNAAIPVVTVLGTMMVGLLGGTVFVEQAFNLGGLGQQAVVSTQNHDLPMIAGIATCFVLGVVIANLAVDVLYGLLDPKARVA